MKLHFDLYSAGALAPGVSSLQALLALQRTGPGVEECALQLPSPQALPANERRRATQAVRLTMACAEEALQGSPFPVDRLRLVFASDEGTGEVCQQMLEALAVGRELSPLQFHNSVHNAPSGYFSIGHQNRQPALSVSLGRESFASGLLCAVAEAHTSGEPVLLVAYDAPMLPPLRSLLPIEHPSATAWVIAGAEARSSERSPLASFEIVLGETGPDFIDAVPAWLPASWSGNSSAFGFVALALLAGATGVCLLRLGNQCLRLERIDGSQGVLNRAQIESRVPHAGSMCLLDAVTQWDATSIVCQAAAPAPNHPLARAGALPAVAAIEYAAQATALHGSLLDAGDAPRDGMLAVLRDVELSRASLCGALTIQAELQSQVASGCLYRFAVHDALTCCARGRLLVAFGP